jgi:hypothetical protein
MARKVFFSFHFENDAWRAGVVRNHSITKAGIEDAGYIDAAAWEEVRKKGDDNIKKWIREQLYGTSVTVVLIGAETASRPYVKYEIEQSIERGNGLLGIYISGIKDQEGQTSKYGDNPLTSKYKTYYWTSDNGYENFASWVEAAAKEAGK